MQFKILFCFLMLFNIAIASESKIIGLLSTKTQLYPNELDFSEGFVELIEGFGAKMQIIDYNRIYSDYLQSKTNDSLFEILENELRENNIKKIIIPGNYYNFDEPPYAPLQNRQLVTEHCLA